MPEDQIRVSWTHPHQKQIRPSKAQVAPHQRCHHTHRAMSITVKSPLPQALLRSLEHQPQAFQQCQ